MRLEVGRGAFYTSCERMKPGFGRLSCAMGGAGHGGSPAAFGERGAVRTVLCVCQAGLGRGRRHRKETEDTGAGWTVRGQKPLLASAIRVEVAEQPEEHPSVGMHMSAAGPALRTGPFANA